MAMGGEEWQTLALYPDRQRLQNNFILLWLAKDDQNVAKDTTQLVLWYRHYQRLKTTGQHYQYFEEQVFGQSTQPVFGFIDTLKRPFGKMMRYTRNKDEVEAFIESGFTKGDPEK